VVNVIALHVKVVVQVIMIVVLGVIVITDNVNQNHVRELVQMVLIVAQVVVV